MNKQIYFFLGIGLVLLISCNSSSVSDNIDKDQANIEGELYFKLVNFGSYYNVPDSLVLKMELYIDSLEGSHSPSSENRKLLDVVHVLEENDLLFKPYFNLRIDSTKIVTVYLDEKEYLKINGFNHSDLLNERKKVLVQLKGKFVTDGIISCEEIISTEKVEGKTYWRK